MRSRLLAPSRLWSEATSANDGFEIDSVDGQRRFCAVPIIDRPPHAEWWAGFRYAHPTQTYSTPIVVRSWNQCCACTNCLILGDSACGLVSCTTHTRAASSTISAWACAINSSCLAGSKVCLASLISASTFGFL